MEVERKAIKGNVCQFISQKVKIPRGFVGLVVHDPKSLDLLVREVVHANARDRTKLELLGSQQPAMANNHDVVAVNDDRLNESVLTDRFGHVCDLCVVVLLGVFAVWLQLTRSFVDNIHENLIEYLSQLITPATKTAINAAGTIAASLPSMLIFTVVLILATYFICYDREKIVSSMKRLINPKRFERLKLIKNKLFQVCGAYFRAMLIMMGIIFCVLLIGFSVLGIESPFFVAFITAIVDAIPVLGTGTVLIPWAIFELISGQYTMALGLAIMYVMAIVVRQFTEPRVVSSQIGLHPLITITSMYVGLKAIGIFGMIVGPVVTIIVIKSLEIDRELEAQIQTEGSSNK